MRPHAMGITARFFVALFVLLAALAAVCILGLRGLADVRAANDQVFSDNLLTADATSQLATGLGNAERIGMEITASHDPIEVAELRAELDEIGIPQVNSDLVRFMALHAHDPSSERAELQRIPKSA